ncbi:hypothetical protein ACHAWO_013483 [Cyclotella atomus]|uniref:Uncharacterized protein n=1 Tax=Cyclotella atomus TaxID=382360 RepID=A0ABD3Q045_9STRA
MNITIFKTHMKVYERSLERKDNVVIHWMAVFHRQIYCVTLLLRSMNKSYQRQNKAISSTIP